MFYIACSSSAVQYVDEIEEMRLLLNFIFSEFLINMILDLFAIAPIHPNKHVRASIYTDRNLYYVHGSSYFMYRLPLF